MELAELKTFVTAVSQAGDALLTDAIQKFRMREITVAKLTTARANDVEPT